MTTETKSPNVLTVDGTDYKLPVVVMDILNATAEERDAAKGRVAELDEVLADFVKCDDLAKRMAARFPEHPGVWTGTVSGRLNLLFSLIQPNG